MFNLGDQSDADHNDYSRRPLLWTDSYCLWKWPV